MYVCTYVCMYVYGVCVWCVCVCVCVCVCMYAYIYVCMHTFMYAVYRHDCECEHECWCMHACMHAYMYVRVNLCKHVCSASENLYMLCCEGIYTRMYAFCACMQACVRMRMCICVSKCICHTYVCMYCIDAHMHAHVYELITSADT